MTRIPGPKGSITFALLAAVALVSPAAQADDLVADAALDLNARPTGWFIAAGGMVVDQQDSGLSDETGMIDDLLAPFAVVTSDFDATFDTGWGMRFALGHALEGLPISIELEYSYRATDIDGIEGPADLAARGDASTHALMLNVVGELDLASSRFGLYGGAGLGLAFSEAELSARIGNSSLSFPEDDDTTFAWQAFGGATYRFTAQISGYAGVRYFDGGDPEYDVLGGENQSVNYELGLRLYF